MTTGKITVFTCADPPLMSMNSETSKVIQRLVLVSLLLETTFCHKLVEFNNAVDFVASSRLEEFSKLSAVSLAACVETCSQMPTCLHVNYNRFSHVCVLIRQGDGASSSTVVTRGIAKGWVKGSKSDWDTVSSSTDLSWYLLLSDRQTVTVTT